MRYRPLCFALEPLERDQVGYLVGSLIAGGVSAGAHDQIRATDRMKHLLAFFVGFEIDVADVLLVLRHISLGAQRRHDGVAQPSPRLHVFGIAAAGHGDGENQGSFRRFVGGIAQTRLTQRCLEALDRVPRAGVFVIATFGVADRRGERVLPQPRLDILQRRRMDFAGRYRRTQIIKRPRLQRDIERADRRYREHDPIAAWKTCPGALLGHGCLPGLGGWRRFSVAV